MFLVLMCCLMVYCCASYGIPSLCLIYKTKVAKVYVDERGNEIEHFERRYRQPRSDRSNGSDDRPASPKDRRHSIEGKPERPSSAGSRRGSTESAVVVRPSSAERRHTVHPGALAAVKPAPVAMSPLSGLKSNELPGLQNATERKAESDSKPLPPLPASTGAPAGSRGAVGSAHREGDDDSQASIQFNLQMWIQSLITANDMLRQQLGIPAHVKSTRKVHDLMAATHPLAVSEINLLVTYAQEMTEENASLQRLLDSGGWTNQRKRG